MAGSDSRNNVFSRRQTLSAALGTAALPMIASPSEAAGGRVVAPDEVWRLREGRSGQFTTFNPETKQKEYNLKPGERRVIAAHDTPGIITRLWMTMSGWFWENWDGDDQSRWPDPRILKLVILRIYWDGAEFPSIEAPIGDFFGLGQCEYRQYLSRYLGLSSGGFYCYFPMPFKKIRIEVENHHDRLVPAIFLNANFQALESLPEDAGRFHCLYNAGINPGSEPIHILDAKGRGHYVGCALSIQGRQPNYLGFLEAPEYFFLDGDTAPSFTGTGLEDYFNGGWYFREGEFSAPFHGAPLKDPLRSMISMYRFQDQDAVAFSKSIRMLFQTPRRPERTSEFKFSSTAYYYAEKASRLAFTLPPSAKLVDWYRIRDQDHQAIP